MDIAIGAHIVQIDADDLHIFASRSWHIKKRTTKSLNGGERIYLYAATGASGRLLLHRLLTGAPPGMVVDHIDGNGLNNTRSNLRVCTCSENARNRRPNIGRALPKGVQRTKRGFAAQIRAGKVRRFERGFATPEDAARRYSEWAAELHGQFWRTK